LFGAQRASEILGEYLSQARKRRIDDVLAARLGSVSVAIEDPYDPHNANAILRTSEAVGLAEIHAISDNRALLQGRRTARGAIHWIGRRQHATLDGFVTMARRRGMRLVGACVEEGMTIPLASVPVDRPLCVLVGNEREGLSAGARAAADLLFRIPMYGMVESLNLSVATAVALYELTDRRRRQLGRDGDLSEEERADLRVSWYAQSLDERLLAGLIHKHQAAQRSP